VCVINQHHTSCVAGPCFVKKNTNTPMSSTPLIEHIKEEEYKGNHDDNGVEENKPYKWRWLLLFVLFVNTVCGALLYLGFSVIENTAKDYFGVSRLAINSLAVLGTGVPILTYPMSARVVDRNGIRACFLIGSVLVCFGSWIRYVGVLQSYWIFFFGHAVVSMGMAFLNSIPAPLSNRFFPVKERSVATSLAMLAFLFGMALGQGICGFFEHSIAEYVLGQAVVLTLPLPIVYFAAQDRPPGNDDEKKEDEQNSDEKYSLFEAAARIVSRPNMRYMCIAAGTFLCVCLSLYLSLTPQNFPKIHFYRIRNRNVQYNSIAY